MLPNVFSYVDYRAFLESWFAARKGQDPSYSYTTFARDGGCSRAALANVISGTRHPRPATLDAFARAMGLDPSARNYLGLLVELASAQTMEGRRGVMDRILSSERLGQLRLAENTRDDHVFRYLEHWWVPVICELVEVEGFREDPAWIAAMLRPRITDAQAAAALATLLELGFVRRTESGGLVRAEIRFRTAPETLAAAAEHFHREAVTALLRAIDASNGSEQHLLAATVTLSPALVPEAKARLNAVIEQLATLGDGDAAPAARRVYQIAVQLLPVTEVFTG
jgi:uncharacterized protein (TIGR02147 family)